MVLFKNAGKQNTEECVTLGLKRAMELNCDIIASSTMGVTADVLLTKAKEMGFQNKIVIVRGCSSKARGGMNLMKPEIKEELIARGAIIVTTAHALSAGERGISAKSRGIYPLALMAETLRCFGQGTKVCFEIAVMALDADAIDYGVPVVAMGGSHRGVDTACVVTPGHSANLLETVVNEIICKPFDIVNPDPSMTFD